MLLQVDMLWMVVLWAVVASAHCNCPCSNQTWCKPITAADRKEVFMFTVYNSSRTWSLFDWTRTTTVGVAGPYSIDQVCLAHQHNARVVLLVDYPGSDMQNPKKRTAWIKKQIKTVQDNYLDGVNIDFEESISIDYPDQKKALTDLVNETYTAFKKAMPHSQVTMDVPYGPNCVYGRCYDFKSLARVVDFFFIMEYDDTWGSEAGPNSGFRYAQEGLTDYLGIISPEKLLLGVPWYGYKYKCSKLTKDQRCTVSQGTTTLPFKDIYNLLSQTHAQRMWDEPSLSPYFSYNDTATKQIYQIWYDDPQSLIYKYNLAAKNNLRGVGVWTAGGVAYDDTPLSNVVRQWMWDALPVVQ